MNALTSFIKRHALASFCTLTIALTFAATLLPLPGEVIPVVMVFIPALMAIALTALSEGKAGVRSLLGKLAQWRISLKWVVIALTLALMMRLTMSLIALGLGLIPALQLRPGPPAQFVILAVILFIFAIPEELGWRGYALPKLLEQRSPLAAGLIVGVLWGSLHLALHLPGLITVAELLGGALGGLVAGAVAALVGQALGGALNTGWGDRIGALGLGALGYLLGTTVGVMLAGRRLKQARSEWLALLGSLVGGGLVLLLAQPFRLNESPTLLQGLFVSLPPITATLAFSQLRLPVARQPESE